MRLLAQAEADAPAGTRLQVVLEATGGNEAALVAALHAPTPPASAAPRSLRPVEDAVAAAFAGRFYEDARQSPRDEALCRTQMDCMENNLFPNGETDTAEACCWACFTLAGQPERLRWR